MKRYIRSNAEIATYRGYDIGVDAYPFPSITVQNAPTIIEADKESEE